MVDIGDLVLWVVVVAFRRLWVLVWLRASVVGCCLTRVWVMPVGL